MHQSSEGAVHSRLGEIVRIERAGRGEGRDSPQYEKPVQPLTCDKGFKNLFVLTMIIEIGDVKHDPHPQQLASWIGMVVLEYSSGDKHPNKVKVACTQEMVGIVWEPLQKVAA